MTPRQEQLQKQIDEKAEELRSIEAMDVTNTEEEEARSAEIETLVSDVEKLADSLKVEERAANARAKVDAIKAANTTKSGLVAPVARRVKAPVVPHATFGEVRGFKSHEDAYKVGKYLVGLANGEYRATSTHPMGSVDTVEADSMGELTPTYDGKGSELVQHSVSNSILDLITYQSIAPRLASMYPIATDGMYLPVGDAAPSANWYLENCEILPVKPKTKRAQLNLHKLGARAQVSNELLADSYISVASLVAQQFASAFAEKLDDTYLNGDSAVSFGGVLSTIPASNTVTAAGAKPTEDEWVSLLSKVDSNVRNPVWLVARSAWGQIMGMAASAVGSNVTQGVPMSLFGVNVIATDMLPAKTLAVFGDFSQATALGYKTEGLTIRASSERAIEFDQMVYVATQRWAFASHSPKYLSALKVA